MRFATDGGAVHTGTLQLSSLPRRREPRAERSGFPLLPWMPALAGLTEKGRGSTGMVETERRYGPRAKTEEDLAPYRDAVNEAAGKSRGLWLGFIALLAYLFISVGAVTHRDLLLENPVRLPVLNVDLPLLGFFGVAPVFFLINHFFLLLQLMGVSRRAREFNEELERSALSEAEQHRIRRSLDSFIIVQMLGGTREEREGLTGFFLKSIALITLVIAPVMLLFLIQLQFLPYQSEVMTWWHRLVLLTELALLWNFWPSVTRGEWHWPRPESPAGALVCVLIFFSCLIATFPGERADSGLRDGVDIDTGARFRPNEWKEQNDSFFAGLKEMIFGTNQPLTRFRKLFPEQRQGIWFLSRTIDLSGRTDLIKINEVDQTEVRQANPRNWRTRWRLNHTISLRERNLRGALLYRSDFRNADFSKASLQGASLEGSRLNRASFESANLMGASFVAADLRGASLSSANIREAVLDHALLQGASINAARLEGASLIAARLQGASLTSVFAQGATLRNARLQGALLDRSTFQGASLEAASLQGASLKDANLEGAFLDRANLDGALLENADFRGVSLRSSSVRRTIGRPAVNRRRSAGVPHGSITAWISMPKLSELTLDQISSVVATALEGVEVESVRAHIRARLIHLATSEEKSNQVWSSTWWAVRAGLLSRSEYEANLASRLIMLVCEAGAAARSITRGLVLSRWGLVETGVRDELLITPLWKPGLQFTGPHLPRVARHLLDAAEGRRDGCPGVRGLDAASIAQLREWAAPRDSKQNTADSKP